MTYLNAKPSSVSNMGEEVLGAARHRNETYDNPDLERQARNKKQCNRALKTLKTESLKGLSDALTQGPDNAKEFLKAYETKKCSLSHEKLSGLSEESQFKTVVLSETDKTDRESMRKLYNKLIRSIRKIKYMRPKELETYFETRKVDSFRELNGRSSQWVDDTLVLSEETRQAVLNNARAIQFGNSIPDSERSYVTYNLNLGLNWLRGIVPVLNLKTLAYSFGARGNAKSVAYYQDSKKLISVNRHNEGSLVHEIGHAIEYAIGSRYRIPTRVYKSYVDQINATDYPAPHKAYLKRPTEVFARMFESYIWSIAGEKNLFMIFIDENSPSMPKVDSDLIEFMTSELKKLGELK